LYNTLFYLKFVTYHLFIYSSEYTMQASSGNVGRRECERPSTPNLLVWNNLIQYQNNVDMESL